MAVIICIYRSSKSHKYYTEVLFHFKIFIIKTKTLQGLKSLAMLNFIGQLFFKILVHCGPVWTVHSPHYLAFNTIDLKLSSCKQVNSSKCCFTKFFFDNSRKYVVVFIKQSRPQPRSVECDRIVELSPAARAAHQQNYLPGQYYLVSVVYLRLLITVFSLLQNIQYNTNYLLEKKFPLLKMA